jgi:hypothetical protein
LSEDSDSEQHSNRSNNTGATTTAADEYAKRRLQMS